MPEPYPIPSAHGDGWFQVDCDWCDWYTTGWEPVCEDGWHEHAAEKHPRRYRRQGRG